MSASCNLHALQEVTWPSALIYVAQWAIFNYRKIYLTALLDASLIFPYSAYSVPTKVCKQLVFVSSAQMSGLNNPAVPGCSSERGQSGCLRLSLS